MSMVPLLAIAPPQLKPLLTLLFEKAYRFMRETTISFEVVERTKQGDQVAFSWLFQRYHLRLAIFYISISPNLGGGNTIWMTFCRYFFCGVHRQNSSVNEINTLRSQRKAVRLAIGKCPTC